MENFFPTTLSFFKKMATSSSKNDKAGVTFQSLMADIGQGNFAPAYLLMGQEGYFIDKAEDALVSALVPEDMRDWALITLFGAETDVETVVTTARGFPMMGERLVVVLKEAQAMEEFARLETYLKQPQSTTVLIVCYKNGTVDKRQKVYTQFQKVGVVFESQKIYENKVPAFIREHVQSKGLSIEPSAAQLMADHIGADLSRVVSELDKLSIAMPGEGSVITMDIVATHIGVSKEFNIFELTDALAEKNAKKAFQIAKYFDNNPKNYPIQRTLPQLFRFFQNLFLAYYAPDRSLRGLANYLGLREWQVKTNVLPPMQHYKAKKAMNILSAIRRTDARSKGIDNPSVSDGELLRELLFYILN